MWDDEEQPQCGGCSNLVDDPSDDCDNCKRSNWMMENNLAPEEEF